MASSTGTCSTEGANQHNPNRRQSAESEDQEASSRMTHIGQDKDGSRGTARFIEDLKATTGSYEDGRGLPSECYYDPAIFRLEQETIFTKEWLCVGRADQIPSPGDYMGMTVAG